MLTTPTKPTSRKILLLGEAPGAEEEKAGQPFVGPSGKLLKHVLLTQAGIDYRECYITNVFQQRPPNNDLKQWTANKTELKKMGLAPTGLMLAKRYLLPQYQPQLDTTASLVTRLQPDLVIALGATALSFLSGDDRIGTFRGSFLDTPYGPAIATFHPAAVLREYKMAPVAVMDLIKARLWLEGALPKPLRRELVVNPTPQELMFAYSRLRARPAEPLGVDIETCPALGQITTISFGFADFAVCIPLWDKDAPAGKENYWPTAAEEVAAWRWIERFAALPNPKVLQNGLYDMQYLLDAPLPIRLAGPIEDTAIMQHAYQPELRKDLGSLASFYLNEPCWKQMRTSAKDAKADE